MTPSLEKCYLPWINRYPHDQDRVAEANQKNGMAEAHTLASKLFLKIRKGWEIFISAV